MDTEEDIKPKDDSFEDGQIAEEETPVKVEKPAPVIFFYFCIRFLLFVLLKSL